MPETLDASEFLTKAGWYHFIVKDVDEAPTSKEGTVQDALKVSTLVLAGSEPSQVGLDWQAWMYNPTPKGDKSDIIRLKQQLKLARACGILPAAKPGQQIEINWRDAIGQQFVAKLTTWTNSSGNERLQFNYTDIFHVRDPEVKDIPMRADAAAKVNHSPADLAEKLAKANGNGVASNGSNGHARPAAQQAAPAQQPVAAGAAAATTFDDL